MCKETLPSAPSMHATLQCHAQREGAKRRVLRRREAFPRVFLTGAESGWPAALVPHFCVPGRRAKRVDPGPFPSGMECSHSQRERSRIAALARLPGTQDRGEACFMSTWLVRTGLSSGGNWHDRPCCTRWADVSIVTPVRMRGGHRGPAVPRWPTPACPALEGRAGRGARRMRLPDHGGSPALATASRIGITARKWST